MPDDAKLDLGRTTEAADHEIIALWPDGPPSIIPDVGPEQSYQTPHGVAAGATMLRNVTEPTLTVFKPKAGRANGVGVIVVPGGGWRILAWEHEGLDLAQWLADRGYTAFVLKYRVMGTPPDPDAFIAGMIASDKRLSTPLTADIMPRTMTELVRGHEGALHAREVAADDGRRAVQVVRERAAQWDVSPDRVGMIGFSAGAFLVADVAMKTDGPPLAFVAPIYGGETRGDVVPADAPPLFTAVAQDDRLLFRMVEGLYADWINADRPAEMHAFTRGAHGFGMVRQDLPVDRWIDLFGDWLKDRGLA